MSWRSSLRLDELFFDESELFFGIFLYSFQLVRVYVSVVFRSTKINTLGDLLALDALFVPE